MTRAVLVAAALLAFAGLARAEDLWPDLSSAGKAVGGGDKDAAVVVGAEKYAFVEGVPGARRNAEDWQSYLTETLKVPFERVALLRDDDATVEEMRDAARKAAAQVKPGGRLWFVFIGHGAPSKDGKDGLLVGVDAQQKAQSVYARSLSRNELLRILASGKQSRAIVLLDACFSGRSTSGASLVAGLQPLVTMGALPAGLDARTVLMTAGRADQFAGPLPRAASPRPAFSYLALGALRGWAADESGKVTANDVVEYTRKALTLAHDRVQTPELAAGSGDALLSTGREPSPNLARIDRADTAAPAKKREPAPAQERRSDSSTFLAAQEAQATKRLSNGALYFEERAGDGARPTASDMVKVNYEGKLVDGTVFDSSYKRGQPASFPLSGVIPCWTAGVQEMRVGGKAKLVCPPSTAYGDRGAGQVVPGGATLIFEVELLGIGEKRL